MVIMEVRSEPYLLKRNGQKKWLMGEGNASTHISEWRMQRNPFLSYPVSRP